VAGAEDALGDAFRAALERWPHDGVPDRPEAWLLTVARSRLVDGVRRATVRAHAEPTLALLDEELRAATATGDAPDHRLGLLFMCAHPAIDASVRTPLMLQTVLGLDAGRIAQAFGVSAATMGQRLVRAKAKIRLAGIAFEVPPRSQWSERIDAVLDAIYAAYGAGWDDVAGADPRRRDLADEAIWLARLVVTLLPDEPEAHGVLALMLHCEARRSTRRGPGGEYVPLSQQDTAQWSRPLMADAERHLTIAAAAGTMGRFQLEAAIQSVHAQRAFSGNTDWGSVVLLYDALVCLSPTVGALVARAAALGQAIDAVASLGALDELPERIVVDYQPFWAVRADALARLGRCEEAGNAYARAIELSNDPHVRDFLQAASAQTSRTPPTRST
jgi:RNA polymerase sigma-70 factor (ECF subfamily)